MCGYVKLLLLLLNVALVSVIVRFAGVVMFCTLRTSCVSFL